MTLHGDETNARVAAVMRAKAKPKKRRVGKKPTSGNSKLPSWYIRPDGQKP